MEVLRFGGGLKGPTILFLHGFPGMRTRQNRDLAQAASERLGARCVLPLYDGLGCAPGLFRFDRCLADVRAFFACLAQELDGHSIHLVGHSWGGFLSLLLASEFPRAIGKIVLLSPLLRFEGVWDARVAFRDTPSQYPALELGDLGELVEGFVKVGRAHAIENVIKSIPETIPIFLIQAQHDPVTPASVAQETLPLFAREPKFLTVENDHSFLNDRDKLAEHVIGFLK